MFNLRFIIYIPILAIIGFWICTGGREYNKKLFIRAINFKYNIDIKDEQVIYCRPYDVIKQVYGKKFDSAFNAAFKGKRTEPTFKKSRFMAYYPVIYAPTVIFGEEGLHGFNEYLYGINYCVIDNEVVSKKSQKDTLRHEISHAAQRRHISIPKEIVIFNKKELADINEYDIYLLGSYEFSVRVAQLKRGYFKKTGIIIDNAVKAREALYDLKKEPYDYSQDARAFLELIESVGKIRNGSKRVQNKIVEYLPQVVRSIKCKELNLS